jgi:membrane protein DedA with SNARE-associated domain
MLEISRLIEHFPYLGIFALLILGALGFPFPEDATLILCGFLIAAEVIKPFPALSVVYAGLLLGDFIVFSVGRKYGRQIVTHKRFRKILTPKKLSLIEKRFNKWGILLVVFGRHILVLRAQIFIVAGVVRMSKLKFFLADAVSAPLTMLIAIGAGYIGGESFQIIKKDITKVEHLGIFFIIVLVVVYLFYQHVNQLRKKG